MSFNVFVRFRPLVKEEIKNGDSELNTNDSTSHTISIGSSVDTGRRSTFKGFTNVFWKETDNRVVFDTALSNRLITVMNGQTMAAFCFGYSGAGKTHTILGYGKEEGLYLLAAKEILASLSGDLMLKVEFLELYGDKVYDLLRKRKEVFMRTDYDGKIVIRGDTTKDKNNEVATEPIGYELCRSADEVESIMELGTRLRRAGASSRHDQSSRSHAIAIFEIVSPKLVELRDKVREVNGRYVKVHKIRDDFRIEIAIKMTYRKVVIDGKETYETVDTRTPEDESFKREKVIESDCNVLQVELDQAKELVENELCRLEAIGGRMIFVDLAGADTLAKSISHKGMSATETKEAMTINQSLLTLQRCISSLKSGKGHTPFRDSKLTRLMETWLRKQCEVVVIANASMGIDSLKATLNTLRYASATVQ